MYALLAAGMATLPQRFISEGATGSSPLQLHLGGGVLSSTTAPPTPLETTLTPTASLPPAVDTPLPVQAATLPYPTPSPTPPPTSLDPREATRNNSSTDDDDDDGDDQDTDTDTAPLQKWPKWLGAATLALVFYDALTLCVFLWLWIAGSLWWLPWLGQAGDDPEERAWEEVRWGVELAGLEEGARTATAREVGVEREMRRMGMV
ncbi:hypothetical protein G6514_003424 [Epicoccum nigrum]|nr:hypothetical protein G6514_003424 [Epicoccum nigrum]